MMKEEEEKGLVSKRFQHCGGFFGCCFFRRDFNFAGSELMPNVIIYCAIGPGLRTLLEHIPRRS